ncbi:ubiquitin carboxyl-terminal hydrolase isozyme L5 isoform X3 [Ranitomeya variabilis]|uniref:ubiquitin carboxyl-terminal hydrolase isozyme L5 isoform X3 n=1 Tax=Ranitomeya variabilis TaxID=490064 RepID=UPI004057657A
MRRSRCKGVQVEEIWSLEQEHFEDLHFLATGESMTLLHYQFRLGISTISGIVKDTCQAIWTTLQPEYIPQPSMEIWLRSAEQFQQICNFPNCVGTVDGKHIWIAKPAGTGSEYYNYKKYFSIVLMAIADANCKFLAVDIGAYGRSNDSQVFKNSPMGRCLYGETYDFPPARPLPGTSEPAMEHVCVGDEAFQLSPHLLKPYSSWNLTHTKRVFNYRLTRARRVVECSFGILTAKWRVLLTAIKLKTTTIDEVVKACVVLHNFVLSKEPVSLDDEELETTLWDYRSSSVCSTGSVTRMRDQFADYFVSPVGRIPWQDMIV